MEYLGAYHGSFLFREHGQLFRQGDDGGHQAMWVNTPISEKEAQSIIASGRDEGDMAFAINSDNVLPGVAPIWETHPIDYLTWHRDHDPAPFRDQAAAALQRLEGAG
jgi:hypothetical protein